MNIEGFEIEKRATALTRSLRVVHAPSGERLGSISFIPGEGVFAFRDADERAVSGLLLKQALLHIVRTVH